MACSIMLFVSCKKDSKTDPPASLAIGDTYQGGIIFSVSGTAPNQHGLIVSPSDLASGATWWNGSNITTNATSSADGSMNTNDIITAQGNTGTYAAKICKDYNGGGYLDWYLPAKDQFVTLAQNSSVVGNLSTGFYWTSTEDPWAANTYAYSYSSGSGSMSKLKSVALRVRAIRAF
ncbi:MAG: hypothetical protein WCO54_12420 [Bacteroidota bacterium]